MASLVHELQTDIRRSDKSVTEILRTAKLISAKLGLSEISEWMESELSGYAVGQTIPSFRKIAGGTLQLLNPYHGWIPAGDMSELAIPIGQPVSELEELAKGKQICITPPRHIPVHSMDGIGDDLVSQFQQRIVNSPVKVKRILEAIKERILDWSIELEQRGILGENMSFDAEEKQSAKSQTFHIQNATGVFGNVSHSQVTIYDYSSIHQTLKQAGVPQDARNEIENIMDALKTAKPEEKKSLIERGKCWMVKNEEFLGASASIIRKAFGLE